MGHAGRGVKGGNLKIRKDREGYVIHFEGEEWRVCPLGLNPKDRGWTFALVSPGEDGAARMIVALAEGLFAARKHNRVLSADLISAYSALADLVHPKDVSIKNEHYEIVKRAHNPF